MRHIGDGGYVEMIETIIKVGRDFFWFFLEISRSFVLLNFQMPAMFKYVKKINGWKKFEIINVKLFGKENSSILEFLKM